MFFVIFFTCLRVLSHTSVRVVANKKATILTNENNRKINQMKRLLINEACFITSNVTDTAAFKKVRLHPMFLAQ